MGDAKAMFGFLVNMQELCVFKCLLGNGTYKCRSIYALFFLLAALHG